MNAQRARRIAIRLSGSLAVFLWCAAWIFASGYAGAVTN